MITRSIINALAKREDLEIRKGEEQQIVGFVTRLLIYKRNELMREEDYAVNTISCIDEAIRQLDCLMDDLDNVIENV